MSLNFGRIAVIGLGYVGLPLAVALSRKFDVVGFDVDRARLDDLREGRDGTGEVDGAVLARSGIVFTADPQDLRGCEIYIVTVPTPIDNANRPDLTAMLKACELVGSVMDRGAIVVFESTVYPGVTEEICAPELEKASGLKSGVDFTLGYSPERINPGDKAHPLEQIKKIVAGQDEPTLRRLSEVYGAIIVAGIYEAPSIKVAEMAKVLENTQRDVNIALMNEVSKICDLMDIRSGDVLEAAKTKWNFLNFYPGLVGGHCIGVDPYYLTAKAEELGYHPEVILSGRRVNDSMGAYIGRKVAKLTARHKLPFDQMRVGILGFTFKENVPDIRNSKVVDICHELESFGIRPIVHDSRANPELIRKVNGIELAPLDRFVGLHTLILAVPHSEYISISAKEFSNMIKDGGIFVDVKSVVNPKDLREDILYWSL